MMKLMWGIAQVKSTIVVTGSCDEKVKLVFLGNGEAEKSYAKVDERGAVPYIMLKIAERIISLSKIILGMAACISPFLMINKIDHSISNLQKPIFVF